MTLMQRRELLAEELAGLVENVAHYGASNPHALENNPLLTELLKRLEDKTAALKRMDEVLRSPRYRLWEALWYMRIALWSGAVGCFLGLLIPGLSSWAPGLFLTLLVSALLLGAAAVWTAVSSYNA